jgi:hypothetical protein
MVADYLDAAPVHQLFNRGRDARYHRLFAIDQRRPVEARLADVDVVRLVALDLVERLCRCDQHFFRHAAAVGAGAAEQIRLDHRDRVPRLARRHGHTHPGIATAERVGIAWSFLKAYCQGGKCRGRGPTFPCPPVPSHALQLEECHGRRGKTDRAIGAGT